MSEQRKGKLIVIEGSDGAGKATQSTLLKKNLEEQGYKVAMFSFPQYEKTFFGKEVGEYLNGGYGDRKNIDPRLIQMLYAGDRFEAKAEIEHALDNFDFVICDRYAPSSVGYGLAKFNTKGDTLTEQQLELKDWMETLEYKVFGIPKPDQIYFLFMPVDMGTKLVEKKDRRGYTDKTKDMHESDLAYLNACNETFYKLSLLEPELWTTIPCCDPDSAEGDLNAVFSIETIQKFITLHLNWCIKDKWHFKG